MHVPILWGNLVEEKLLAVIPASKALVEDSKLLISPSNYHSSTAVHTWLLLDTRPVSNISRLFLVAAIQCYGEIPPSSHPRAYLFNHNLGINILS